MEKMIVKENIDSFAYVCDTAFDVSETKAVCIDFQGLGSGGMFDKNTNILPPAKTLAEGKVLFVIPYLDPWNWMREEAVTVTDEIIDAVYEKYGFDDSMPLVFTGHSMGGQCCLCYAVYSKRTPTAVAADCPVCDMPYHITERADLPRTIYNAYRSSSRTMKEELEYRSPLHLASAGKFPRETVYFVIHGDADTLVNKAKHSDRFVSEMKKNGYDITYAEIPGMQHCQLTGESYDTYWGFVNSIGK